MGVLTKAARSRVKVVRSTIRATGRQVLRLNRASARVKAPQDLVTAYERAVVVESTIAGPHVRDVCKRHLYDLEHGQERGIRINVEKINRATLLFPSILRLNDGVHEGRRFELLD